MEWSFKHHWKKYINNALVSFCSPPSGATLPRVGVTAPPAGPGSSVTPPARRESSDRTAKRTAPAKMELPVTTSQVGRKDRFSLYGVKQKSGHTFIFKNHLGIMSNRVYTGFKNA